LTGKVGFLAQILREKALGTICRIRRRSALPRQEKAQKAQRGKTATENEMAARERKDRRDGTT